ncbi:hypothetical protein [Streptomyces erythrochromogenes]|uniref:hypothetical protein n=1 Tax=Streptomyces erythrochromogenes TaxID=285574 RepID=UPI00386CB230|nr:hypothetical protein OG364_33165 [Streptomyces erythrochromogenes]
MYGVTVADAERAVRAAERRKLPVPPEVYEAKRLQAAVFDTGHTPDPERPALPATAAQAAAVIQQHAEALRLADATRRAAELFAEEAAGRFVAEAKAAVPKWVAGLDKEFCTLLGIVRKAAAKLPQDITLLDPKRINWNDPVITAAYTKAEGAVVQLEQLVSDRANIARAAGSDGGRDNALFSVAAMPEPTVQTVMDKAWQDLHPVIAQWRDLHQQPVARWVYLVRQQALTLGLATPGQVRERAGCVQLWRDATHARSAAQSLRGAHELVAQALSG